MNRLLAAILFLFEPFLAANLLLRVGPSLFQRDWITWAAFAARMVLAVSSVVAARAVLEPRPEGPRLAAWVLAASAAFAVLQYLTLALPTSVAPDAALLFTAAIVLHHGVWLLVLWRRSRVR